MIIRIQFSPTFCTFVEGLTPEIAEEIYNLLVYRPTGYFFMSAFQAGRWDGYNRLYYPALQRFRSGLLSRVVEYLQGQNHEVEILGLPKPETFVQRSSAYTLRPYQLAAVQDVTQKRFGILQAPMRSGKTLMFIAAIDSERKFPAIFFCRSLDLAYQTVDRIKQFLPDISVGLVGDGKLTIGDVTVVTVQSAYSAYAKKFKVEKKQRERELVSAARFKLKDLIRRAQAVFYDEVHHMQGTTSRFLMDKCVAAELRIGLSATPFAGEEEDILTEQSVGPVIHEVSYSELIRENFILRPYIYMYKIPPVGTEGAYQTVYKEAVTDNEFLTELVVLITRKLVSLGKSVVVQTEMIEHTKKVAEAIGCPTLTGQDKTEYRQEIFNKLRSKELMCVVSTLFEEGLDIPSLDYTINLAGGLSSIGTFQRMRSLTAIEGKTTCGIIDFYHSDTFLVNHSRARKRIYQSEPEFKLEMRDIRNYTIEELRQLV